MATFKQPFGDKDKTKKVDNPSTPEEKTEGAKPAKEEAVPTTPAPIDTNKQEDGFDTGVAK